MITIYYNFMNKTTSKDPYKILEINRDADLDTIKKAYRNQARRYHPDKCKDVDTVDKFHDVQTAYEILSNEKTRNNFDNSAYGQQDKLYDEIKSFIVKKNPEFNQFFDYVIKNFFSEKEEDLRSKVNNFDLAGIYESVITNIPIVFEKTKFFKPDKDKPEINIKAKLYAKLSDRYANKYVKVKITRETRETIEKYVALKENQVIFKGEGEYNCNTGMYGDVILDIIIDPDLNFICDSNNSNDLNYICEISLYDFLYGGELNITHLDGELISLKYDSFINKNTMLVIKNKGLVINSDTRGDLLIYFKIKNLDNIKDKLKALN